jgi:eukaryotic translation initiation factor 2C
MNPVAHIPQDIHEIRRFRNFDIDTNAFKLTIPASLPQRPAKFNTLGKEAVLTLNTFNVIQAPNRVVHQYDVSSLLLPQS